ncbi:MULTISPECIES: hypothetical protein [unclassified Sphingomonas]|uniref:hypothetical protein n=1 Tax=unclassified Sphingomonas TaxID=196159 RepID=UPI002269F48C|nr:MULTISPECIES: hypothetical protein [unclassified Sphingomonas]
MTPDEQRADDLNVRAYLAMSRVEANIVKHLTALLRSDVPIDPMVRRALADAFEGRNVADRVTFKVTDLKAGPLGDIAERRYRFQRDMAIARYIEERRSGPDHLTLDAAERAAESIFGIGQKTCHAAVGKARKMAAWVAQRYPERPALLRHLTPEQYRHQLECEYFLFLDQGGSKSDDQSS